MTLETRRVSARARWNRQRLALARRLVTGCAVRLARVTAVIEPGIETLKSRKTLQSIFRVAVIAKRMLAVLELFNMATCTRYMTGKAHRCRVIIADMTNKTGKPCVLRVAVLEIRIILRNGRLPRFCRLSCRADSGRRTNTEGVIKRNSHYCSE